jgi:hypothetical protein
MLVTTPALDRSTAEQGARVIVRCRELYHAGNGDVASINYTNRCEPIGGRTISQLSVRVTAPTFNSSATG